VEPPGNPPDPLPFTVIGGYLGAGKTTLVNRLLHDSAIGRAAVLVNDFGDIDIDSSLIESHDGDTIALANGCVCCTLVDGLSTTLARIRDRAGDFDRVIVEVSGVGDPWKVAQWGRSPGFSLDAVVVLADAETVIERADHKYVGDTVRRQLAGADVVVITKHDLVDDDRIAAVHNWLTETVDATIVTGSDAIVEALLIDPPRPTDSGPGAPTMSHARHVVASRSFTAPLDRSNFDDVMTRRPAGVLRVKGRVVMAGSPDRTLLVQVVGRRVEVSPARDHDGGGDLVSALVAVASPELTVAEVDDWLTAFEA